MRSSPGDLGEQTNFAGSAVSTCGALGHAGARASFAPGNAAAAPLCGNQARDCLPLALEPTSAISGAGTLGSGLPAVPPKLIAQAGTTSKQGMSIMRPRAKVLARATGTLARTRPVSPPMGGNKLPVKQSGWIASGMSRPRVRQRTARRCPKGASPSPSRASGPGELALGQQVGTAGGGHSIGCAVTAHAVGGAGATYQGRSMAALDLANLAAAGEVSGACDLFVGTYPLNAAAEKALRNLRSAETVLFLESWAPKEESGHANRWSEIFFGALKRL